MVDYEGDTDKNSRCSDDSPTETDDCLRNLYKVHENEDDEEFKEDTSVINTPNESQIIKEKKEEVLINRMLAINFLLKFIQAVIFSMNTYEKEILSVGNEDGKIKKQR